ncbi:HD domain-containing protein [Schumannella luteola]|uniref:Catechol 2,3-dioxygenase-like lactoylglutathione lyase family enzyme n=1 Tax=Schumannella luteola TaxID=472059 RepID=A0A852YDC8_9MICO|nr:HD domain-containing protein [Schumannella luteola]NYG99161.1 catechol 2,3-dioxygenase-like lactoylglutathione lyase family enzyme [Schumannella luteola]TPX06212.1 HD domain-containing protein [Schumannella luteola]
MDPAVRPHLDVARFSLPAPPDTPAVRAAVEVLDRYASPAIRAHSWRSWHWALGFGEQLGLPPVDAELLCVAALLHDIGLARAFDAAEPSYEEAGGHVAWAVAAGAGWPAVRRDRLAEVIVRHNWPEVPVDDPDGHLLEIATGLDISGARPDALPTELVDAVLARFPRGELGTEFGALVTAQAQRKPSTQARRLVESGLVGKLAAHPHEHRATGPDHHDT